MRVGRGERGEREESGGGRVEGKSLQRGASRVSSRP